MAKKIRWGLLGAGSIVGRWMNGAAQVEDMEVAAVASRTRESAERQAEKCGIPVVMTYEELLADPDIDAVYVPVPHTAHKELVLRALNAGKAVLVEKPGAVTAADWEEMSACARKRGVFLMEAVWTRFFPLIERVLSEIAAGTIGDVRCVQAAFCGRVGDGYKGRLFDPAQAGGALLDVGVYDLHFAQMVYGRPPVRLTGFAARDTDDLHLQVDEQAAFVGIYENGALSVLTCAIRTGMPDTAWIYGTKGYLRIPVFWKPVEAEIVVGSETRMLREAVPQSVPGVTDEGYQFEIRHVNECLRRGLTESPVMPMARTGEVLRECDELRRQWGLVYPFER